jgi:hypothetical protein
MRALISVPSCAVTLLKKNGYMFCIVSFSSYVWISTKPCIIYAGETFICSDQKEEKEKKEKEKGEKKKKRKDVMRGLLLLQLPGLCDTLSFRCSPAFSRIIQRCQWVGMAGLDLPRIMATCEYLDCGYL